MANRFDEKTRRRIFERTDGECHLCGKQMYFKNYGSLGAKGAWEVEHSNPQAKGGTDHLNNLYAAHIRCNREKGTLTTKTARRKYDRTRAPYSKQKKTRVRLKNTLLVSGICGLAFRVLLGPAAIPLGLVIGALVGNNVDPNKTSTRSERDW